MTLLLGSYVEGKPHIYPLPGAYLNYNGYALIKDVEIAKNICYEVNRQGGGIGFVGTLDIKITK
jgi:hypothetical protein